MTYQQNIESMVDRLEQGTQRLDGLIEEARVRSNNTAVLRAANYPQDFINLFGPQINNSWYLYPLSGNFIVNSDNDILITTDAVLQSYGVLIQLSYDITGRNGFWSPGDDDGMMLDRRFGGVQISSIGRKQAVHFVKLPRGEYNLQAKVRPVPDSVGQGQMGVAEVSIGVRGI